MKATSTILLASLLVWLVVSCTKSKSQSSITEKSTVPRQSVELNDAMLLYDLGKIDEAERKLVKVLEKEPDNPQARDLAVQLLLWRHQPESRDKRGVRPYIQTIPQQRL